MHQSTRSSQAHINEQMNMDWIGIEIRMHKCAVLNIHVNCSPAHSRILCFQLNGINEKHFSKNTYFADDILQERVLVQFCDDDRAEHAKDEDGEKHEYVRDGHDQQGQTASVLEPTGLLPGELL
jgi:hypothetical protein